MVQGGCVFLSVRYPCRVRNPLERWSASDRTPLIRRAGTLGPEMEAGRQAGRGLVSARVRERARECERERSCRERGPFEYGCQRAANASLWGGPPRVCCDASPSHGLSLGLAHRSRSPPHVKSLMPRASPLSQLHSSTLHFEPSTLNPLTPIPKTTLNPI